LTRGAIHLCREDRHRNATFAGPHEWEAWDQGHLSDLRLVAVKGTKVTGWAAPIRTGSMPAANVYTDIFTVESLGLFGDRHVQKIGIGDTQGLGLLQLAGKHNFNGIDTNRKVAKPTNDQMVSLRVRQFPSRRSMRPPCSRSRFRVEA
jgi:hypothetical protein